MRRAAACLALATVVIVGAGCRGVGDPSPAPTSPLSTPTRSASGPPVTVAPSPTVTPADGPPGATLTVDGGDPVAGQLGTFVWRESGSDAPWLPGAPIAVGAGEALVVSLDPSIAVAEWSARYAPAGSDAADGTAPAGDGAGPTVVTAPPVGRWTVAVTITFGDDLGEATYYWAVEVR